MKKNTVKKEGLQIIGDNKNINIISKYFIKFLGNFKSIEKNVHWCIGALVHLSIGPFEQWCISALIH